MLHSVGWLSIDYLSAPSSRVTCPRRKPRGWRAVFVGKSVGVEKSPAIAELANRVVGCSGPWTGDTWPLRMGPTGSPKRSVLNRPSRITSQKTKVFKQTAAKAYVLARWTSISQPWICETKPPVFDMRFYSILQMQKPVTFIPRYRVRFECSNTEANKWD